MHKHINKTLTKKILCSDSRSKKPLEINDQMVRRSCWSMVAPSFSGVLVFLSGDVICGNILNISWGGIQTTKPFAWNKLIYMRMPCLVRYRVAWTYRSCVWTFVSQKTRILEFGVIRMGYMVYATITVYLRPMSKWIAPSSSVTSKILQDSILSVILWKVIFVTVSVLLG